MFSKFSEDAQKVLLMAKKEMIELKHPYVGSEHLLLAILHNEDLKVTEMLKEYGITYKKFRNEIIKVIGIGKKESEWFLYTPLLKRVIENAILDCEEEDTVITVEALFMSLLEEGEGVANRILLGMDVDLSFLYEKFSKKIVGQKKNNHLLLEDFAINLNNKCQDEGFDPVIGRENEVNRLIEILLRRTKNNPLLIGETGVGKTAIVEELVRKIVKGDIQRKLRDSKIYSISMASLVSGTKYRGEFEERINKIIAELENEKNIILFIDEIHTLVGAGGAEGAIDASNILKPYLARGKIKIIGATTINEYSKYIEKDKALDRRFQKIFVDEPTKEKTEEILLNLKEIYENYHGVVISKEIIKLIVDLADRYVTSSRFPDKAIDILDEACTKAILVDNSYEKKYKDMLIKVNNIKLNKNKAIIDHDYKLASNYKDKENELENSLNKLFLSKNKAKLKKISKDDVYEVLYAKTKIPVKKILSLNKNSIYNNIISKIKGQDLIIKDIINFALGVKYNEKVPISLLLVGKSGVGKTFLVKEYARMLYPKESFIKLDMSEYKESHAISKIIGSPPGYVGYDDNNFVLDRIKKNPYSVLLLDEIEKAHPDVLKLFLQVLDDGYMTTSKGEMISFSNTIIFMTSNLGSDVLKIGFSDNKSLVKEKFKDFLGVEFVNRIGKIVIFNDLDDKSINTIIKLKLEALNYNKNEVSKELLDRIKRECNYKEFGARQIDKVIVSIMSNSAIVNR